MARTILHSDCNCFYASVELLHHPKLRGKPVAVGGDPEARHGIVLTADYVAKRHGVKTGMALWQARQVCPEITFLPPRMDLYLRFSKMAQEIYGEYTDLREPFGIDEFWLDVTDSVTIKGDGLQIAQEIRQRMKKELGITVSIGVSFNKIFAKLGSDYKKPDAITTMYQEEFREKAWPLPVSDLLYVGGATNKKLLNMGILTIGALAQTEESVLTSRLGKMGSILWAFANGYDDSPVKLENTGAPIKSVGNSTTTPKDMETDEDVKIVLYILAESVAARLRENGFRCRTVEISLRDKDLFSFTRQGVVSLSSPQSCKGLDFPVVLYYLDHRAHFLNVYDEETADKMNRNMIYTAITRGSELLHIFMLKDSSSGPVDDLRKILKELMKEL